MLIQFCTPLNAASDWQIVSRSGLAVRRYRLVSRGSSVRIRFSSPFSSKAVISGLISLVTLSLTINKTLEWLSSLPILMQESFWWGQCSNRYIFSLFPHLHTLFPSFSPSLISLMVSVEFKHHVYLFTYRHRLQRITFSYPLTTVVSPLALRMQHSAVPSMTEPKEIISLSLST